jgi:hypothetical protein
MIPKLSNEVLLLELASRKGLIPIAITEKGEQMIWQDLENYHFYEGFFHKSLSTFAALKGGNVEQFITDVSVLKNQSIATGSLYPTGFIFHAGRCGSTTLTKVLARSRRNLVIGESDQLNRIWQTLTQNGAIPLLPSADNLAMYRALVLAAGRKRVKTHQRYFIKFSSFNILFFDFIHAAFPDVPCIFLRRPITEILTSWQKRLPGWLGTDDPWMMELLSEKAGAGLKEIVEGFFRTASAKDQSLLKHIDYQNLNTEGLPKILADFNVFPEADELQLMASQFHFDAKTEFNKKKFGG